MIKICKKCACMKIQLFWDVSACQLVNSCELQGFHSCVIVESGVVGYDTALNDLEPLKMKVVLSF